MNKEAYLERLKPVNATKWDQEDEALRAIAETWRKLAIAQQQAGLCDGPIRVRIDLTGYFSSVHRDNLAFRN